ncbi:MAG: flagellar motor switch protein FliN [Gemmatimonadetes bacterium]|jgi:flagellar motor switch protein FliN|nr:flagellar motor switch protein FliN [Gemmatimonadota bacterium]MBT4608732.1 flagellar motor switch protein FliN [Gemmatimonadota bacterium]MBT5058657.1 flagellar motor switch protein FliN [Gemmatimonadota bacterium]MBT5586566.1 flagellar motor switch protein FliN [Gemmatimonadota bacterium]MBT5964402.1 flagellar motor switch protein FliN [Gemmatimonadota bacterium]
MAEEDDVLGGEDMLDDVAELAEDAAALEDALSSEDDGEDELDPLAEEMLRMMEEEGDDSGGDSGGDDVDEMMEMEMLKAMEEEGGAAGGGGGGALQLGGGGGTSIPPNLERLMDVSLTVTIELGRTRETIETVMEYGDQSLIELDRTVGEPVDVLVNGELFARGEVVTVSENFGVRITELVNPLHK